MAMQHQEKQDRDQENQERQQRNALIGEKVLHALGEPADLRKVLVRRLWADRYRVNVLVGVDAATTKVAHSYFLVVGSEGNIIASTPAIAKQY
jgi:hypothetical protein